MYVEHNRALSYAVLASLVLHGWLLFGVSQRERSRPAAPPAPLLARLVELPSPVPAAAAPAPRAEPQRLKQRAKPAPKPLAKEKPAPQPEPATEEAPVAQIQSEPVRSESTAPPVLTRADPAPGPALATAPAAAEPVPDPGSLEKYRHALVLAAPQYKRYPRIATDNNWKGLVALRMVMAPGGRIASMTVTKTSGYDVLDQQALEMFRKAAEVVPVPPVLRGKEFAVEVAADYYFTD
jgi:periplasmic protein TonB